MSTLKLLKLSCKTICQQNIRNYSCALSSMVATANQKNSSNSSHGILNQYSLSRNAAYTTLTPRQLDLIRPFNNANFFSTKPKPDSASDQTDNAKSTSDDKLAKQQEIEDAIFDNSQKLGLFARFKLMYKKYWYVLIPVHVVTSIGWLGGFYYLSKSGVDVPSLLQYIHLSETIISKVQNSDMGHYAIAYLCYKVATPLRYAVTLGGTTVSIKVLVQSGYIKPVPTKEELIQMYEDKKADRAKRKEEKTREE